MPMQESPVEHSQGDVSSSDNNNTSRRRLLHLLGAGSVAGLAGCAGGGGQDTETEKDAGTEKTLSQSVSIGVKFDVSNGGDFNFDLYGGVGEYYTRIFESLTWVTHDLRVKPNLATDWRATGEKTWEFDLREGVKFHNDKPLNADAVVFSLKERLSNGGDWVTGWAKTKPEDVRKVDNMTVEVTNTRPYPGFPGLMTHLFFVIQHPDRTLGNPIGTGPYKVEEKEKGHHVTVSAFEDYWGEPPKIETVTYRGITDRNTRALAVKGDKIDIGLELPPSQFYEFRKSGKRDAVKQAEAKPVWATFEVKQPTTDIKLRKALNYAISQKKIVNGSQNGIGIPAKGPIPRMVWWSVHDSLPPYGPDKKKAKQLVDESSYNGETLKLLGNTDGEIPTPHLIGQVIQQQAGDIGVDIEPKMMGSGAFSEAKDNNQGHLYLNEDSIPYAGSLYIFNFDPTRNYLKDFEGFKDVEKIRSLASKGLEAQDSEVKKDALGEAQHILMENAYIIPLFHTEYVVGMRKGIGEFEWHPLPHYQRWEKFEAYE